MLLLKCFPSLCVHVSSIVGAAHSVLFIDIGSLSLCVDGANYSFLLSVVTLSFMEGAVIGRDVCTMLHSNVHILNSPL